VKPLLTNVAINSGNQHTMAVATTWTIPLTLTPASGAFGDYVLESSNPSVVRIEENSKAFAVSPGTATITAVIDGVASGSCHVTVSSPQSTSLWSTTNPGLKYYNVTFESNGMATIALGIVPLAGAVRYEVYEHVSYFNGMTLAQLYGDANIKKDALGDRIWGVAAANAGSPVLFEGTQTGLRIFSVVAVDGSNQMIDHSVVQAPVLHYPRNFGRTSNNDDTFVMAMLNQVWLYMPDMFFGGHFAMVPAPTDPFAIRFTFDPVPGATGYKIFFSNNGTSFTPENRTQPANQSTRLIMETGFVFNSGTVVVNILPYVMSLDGSTELYGEMRTLVYRVNTDRIPALGNAYKYAWWENATTLNSDVLQIKAGVQ
jgi:hypothetical protein